MSNSRLSLVHGGLDKITSKYLTEVKKSDADIEAAKWQIIYYLKVLKDKGIIRKGKLEFVEKNKNTKKVIEVELTEEIEKELEHYVNDIINMLKGGEVPQALNLNKCKKCAYYEYCYI